MVNATDIPINNKSLTFHIEPRSNRNMKSVVDWIGGRWGCYNPSMARTQT